MAKKLHGALLVPQKLQFMNGMNNEQLSQTLIKAYIYNVTLRRL